MARYNYPTVKEGFDRKVRTSPSSKVWHWIKAAPLCKQIGEVGAMATYLTRCGTEILAEVADRDLPIAASHVECSSCMTNRLYSERALIERANKEIRDPKTETRKFPTFAFAHQWVQTTITIQGLVLYVSITGGDRQYSSSSKRSVIEEYEATVRYYTHEQMRLFAEEANAAQTTTV